MSDGGSLDLAVSGQAVVSGNTAVGSGGVVYAGPKAQLQFSMQGTSTLASNAASGWGE